MRKWVAVVALLVGCQKSHLAGSGPGGAPPGDFTPRDLGVTGATDENMPPPPDLATPAGADLAPARAVGMKTCFVNRSGQPRPEGEPPDLEVPSLSALADALGA